MADLLGLRLLRDSNGREKGLSASAAADLIAAGERKWRGPDAAPSSKTLLNRYSAMRWVDYGKREHLIQADLIGSLMSHAWGRDHADPKYVRQIDRLIHAAESEYPDGYRMTVFERRPDEPNRQDDSSRETDLSRDDRDG